MKKSFKSKGKLLLTGEYVVLDGALSLAIPTKFGQDMVVEPVKEPHVIWQSKDHHGAVWFEHSFQIEALKRPMRSEAGNEVAGQLHKILNEAYRLNPTFLYEDHGYRIATHLDFPRNWGLGSSSTLINNIAQWAKVDAYELLWKAFTGSGYDIACAQNHSPLLYRLVEGRPQVETLSFSPPFADQLFFVFLNKKQDSREGISHYKKQQIEKNQLIKEISAITREVVHCKDIQGFATLMETHENLMSSALALPTVKQNNFPDYPGMLKSLGAWGGDFILALGEIAPAYFKKQGYSTVIPYTEMVAK